MATDARGHTVPASGDHPSRATLLALALGIRDVIPVTNTTTRAAVITAMASAGASVATSNPVIVYRADADPMLALEMTVDGSTWLQVASTLNAQTWTPALTATPTPPNFGSTATTNGSWRQTGKQVFATGEMVAGGTGITGGSGTWSINLPVATTSAAATAGRVLGSGVFFHTSTGNFYNLQVLAVTTTAAKMSVDAGPLVQSGTPVALAAGDQLRISLNYEAA